MASDKGLMFVRKIGPKTIVVGVFDTEALPGLKEGHQHLTVIGNSVDGVTNFVVLNDRSIDRKEETRGNSIDGILCDQIWQN